MSIFSKKEKKPMDAMQAFIADYRKVAEKHGYDLESVGWLASFDGSVLETPRLKQLNKELSEFLKKRKIILKFDFTICKLSDKKKTDEPNPA